MSELPTLPSQLHRHTVALQQHMSWYCVVTLNATSLGLSFRFILPCSTEETNMVPSARGYSNPRLPGARTNSQPAQRAQSLWSGHPGQLTWMPYKILRSGVGKAPFKGSLLPIHTSRQWRRGKYIQFVQRRAAGIPCRLVGISVQRCLLLMHLLGAGTHCH